jgi:hypothetical protein
METQATSIEAFDAVESDSLPNGDYEGIWGGYVVTAEIGGRHYHLKTKDGIRCSNCACTVLVRNGVVSVRL